MKNHRLQFLLKSLVDNTISKEELDELAEILNHSGDNADVHSEMKSIWEEMESSNNNLNEDLYAGIVSSPRFFKSTKKKYAKTLGLKRNNLIYYAAAILLVCSFGLGIFLYKNQVSVNLTKHYASNTDHKKAHNTEHVVLTLSNGKKIILDQLADGQLTKDDNALISKVNDGQVVYNLSNLNTENKDNKLVYNTISTPVGKNYQLILADGTRVWLNAMSSLRFPVSFVKEERDVELSGEGYFEVAKDKTKPFMVAAKNMKIQVLGTHFNVSAYSEDNIVEASLLEGAIKADNGTSSILLKPGQQAILRNGSANMKVQSFNSEEVTDWKNGYFIFRNEPIEEIMKKISRWYNIDVKYQGIMSEEAFGGKYLKSNSLSELLSSLELTGTVKFKIDGRRVTVMQ
ncbi:FecR domain-containing protein [Pedobacter sp. ASV1-7]|uniref:FecR family protein n=1 Tax=Pedobacter sp. ASV1-7 TaxID=3145237 RepID=UPI0032E9328E